MSNILFITVYQQKPDGTLAIIIPQQFRDRLKIEKGDLLAAYIDEESRRKALVLTPVPKEKPKSLSKSDEVRKRE